MIIIYNFITLCKYLINYTIGYKEIYCIEFEYEYKDVDFDDDENEPRCGCNLCYTWENIVFFLTRPLKLKKI